MDLIGKYAFTVQWDEVDSVYIANCAELPTILAHGGTQEQALVELRIALEATIELMQETGQIVPEPLASRKFSGNLSLRLPPDSHRLLALRSAQAGVSINQYITSLVDQSLSSVVLELDIGKKLEALHTSIEDLRDSIRDEQQITFDFTARSEGYFYGPEETAVIGNIFRTISSYDYKPRVLTVQNLKLTIPTVENMSSSVHDK